MVTRSRYVFVYVRVNWGRRVNLFRAGLKRVLILQKGVQQGTNFNRAIKTQSSCKELMSSTESTKP
jgi:hypothetical protein